MVDTTATHLTIAELYEIVLTNGDTAYFTSHPVFISYGGNNYQALPIQRNRVRYHIDLEVDRVNIIFGLVNVQIGVEVGGILYTLPQVVKNDFMRNAHVTVSRIDYELLGTPDIVFEGWVTGDVSYTGGAMSMHVGSILDRLKDPFPTFLFSELCNHQLYGTYCTLNRATYVESGTADAGSTQAQVFDAIFLYAGQPLDHWYKGELKFTSGDNLNITREIVTHNDGDVETLLPFPNPVAVGDTFEAVPGCDKTATTCASTKFSDNMVNFGGFEHIPKPEDLFLP